MNRGADVRAAVGRNNPVAVREIGQHEHEARRLHDAERPWTVGLLWRPQWRAERQRVHVSRKHFIALRWKTAGSSEQPADCAYGRIGVGPEPGSGDANGARWPEIDCGASNDSP